MKELLTNIPCGEGPVWADIEGKWHCLYGSFPREGVSIEWHDFATEKNLNWGLSFHDRSLEICLNFMGQGAWQRDGAEVTILPKQVAIYTGGQSNWEAVRHAGTAHRFFTLELSPEYLQFQLGKVLDGVRDEIRQFIETPEKTEPFLDVQSMITPLLSLRQQLLQPPISQSSYSIWYPSKILEILAHLLFKNEQSHELFCDRHKRANKERIERAAYLLKRDLSNPPSLEMMAQEVHCSTFHLSRIFAQEMGMTIPRYLRMLRIEKAAELLSQGRGNVTETAFAVGYNSLSAFNQAFVEIMGCCPGLYPVAQKLIRKNAFTKILAP